MTADERQRLRAAYNRRAASHWPDFEAALEHPLYLRILRIEAAHPREATLPATVFRSLPTSRSSTVGDPLPRHTARPLDNKQRASGERDDD